MKTVRVFVERGKDGTFGAYMPDDNGLSYGVIGEGATAAEAIADFNAVYESMKDSFAQRGLPFEEVTFKISYDVASFLSQYSPILTLRGLAKVTGVSAAQLSHYATGYRHPSPKTTAKIQEGIHRFAHELAALSLA